MNQSERVLVTGCAGFIGHHLVKRLLNDGYNVVGVDDFSTGYKSRIASFINDFEFIEGNLCNPLIAEKAVQGVGYILHQATIPSAPRSIIKPLESFHSTLTASLCLYTAARAEGVRRIIQASSSAVYGNIPAEVKREDMAVKPLSPYAVAKYAQELYGSVFCSCYGMDILSLRYFNVFGPGQSPEGSYVAVVPQFTISMLKGDSPQINGDGSNSRNYIFVDNVIHANMLALKSSKTFTGEAVNIAGNKSITLLQLIEILNRLIGSNIQPKFAPPRIGDVLHSNADTQKAEELLNYKQLVSFHDGLQKTLNYYTEYKGL